MNKTNNLKQGEKMIKEIKENTLVSDEHIEYFTKVPEPEIPVHEDKPTHCGSHTRFIKSCHQCLAVTQG